MLGLGLGLSGATRGLIVLSDRTVLATAGDPLAREELDGALAELALSQPAAALIPDLAADKRIGGRAFAGVGLFAAVPLTAPGGDRLGALVLAAKGRAKPAAELGQRLEELAFLAADELGNPRPGGEAADERDALLAEIDHRVRNVLATVQSMASQSARRAGSLDGFLKAFTGRLKAMASAQELLTATRGRGATIHQVATATLSALAPGQTRWEGPELILTPRAATALALALHELAVNAVKHGALTSEMGEVDVRWRRKSDGGFELDWVETGGPYASPPAHKGFGSLLLEQVTGRELEGEVQTEFKPGGVRVKIRAGAKALVEDDASRAKPAPAAPAPARPAAEPAPATAASKVEGMKVIIVEDAILLAMELEAGLEEAGAEVVGSAALLEEAMALVDLPMDAAVLDCNLNGSSVGPVAEALAARGVPFLFATGYGENRGAPEGFDAPIIRKPYDVAQIAAALAELTGRA
jgi:two-component sensor histidine kinase/CheY-like chemotaxis protein